MIRSSSDKQRNSLKMAFRVSVEHGGGGKAISEITRVSPPIITNYAAPHEDLRFPGVDVALDVDLAVGEPINARALAAAQGYELVRCTEPAGSGGLGLRDLSSLSNASHTFEQHIIDALEDSNISEKERLELIQDIAVLQSRLSSIQQKLSKA